ncbi:peptidase S8/S53 domain-containing protein, partial [Paraphysoderma sedebokerense]
INVIPLWKRGINGSGIHISIIDDGIEGTHPDLADNFAADLSFNFLERNSDIMPRTKEDNHGTRCAGEIASKPNNTVCGVGVAYGAIISGERLIGDIAPEDADEAAAFNHHYQIHEIYSQSWGPKDDGATVDKPGPLATKALQEGVERGRNGRGSLFVFASGNGGKHKDNCNYDGYANSINTITIGSTKSDGTSSTFAEICAAQLAVTFGGGSPNYISTTDINGGCTRQHQGTSAAAPIAAGILALVLQVRPDLSWRDIHHLLVTSAFRNDISHPDWTKNGAGLFVNHMYGFGMIDAEILVNNSITFKSVPSPALTYSTPLNWIRRPIPIDSRPIEEQIVVTESDTGTLSTLEHVQVKVMIKHPNRGNLTIALVSPSNTTSLLGTVRSADTSTDGLPDWTFMTVRHWNERVHGTWKL